MNEVSVYERCLEEYQWRKDELDTLFEDAKNSSEKSQKILLKSLILIIYAHWEGLVIKSLEELCKFLNKQSLLTAKSCSINYLLLALRDKVKGMETNDMSKRKECMKEIIELVIVDQEIALKHNEIKALTASNLNAKALKRICDEFHISLDFLEFTGSFDSQNHPESISSSKDLLDRLVHLRNAIAHGETSEAFSSIEDSQKFIDLYELLGLEFIDEIDKVISKQKFLKESMSYEQSGQSL